MLKQAIGQEVIFCLNCQSFDCRCNRQNLILQSKYEDNEIGAIVKFLKYFFEKLKGGTK
jgi:hypothetical protein